VITETEIKPSPEKIDEILSSSDLTAFQKITFKQTVTQESVTNRYVISLNKPAELLL
jgi:hypothetical protein